MKSLSNYINESLNPKPSPGLEKLIRSWMKSERRKESYEEIISSYLLMKEVEDSKEMEELPDSEYHLYEEFDELLYELSKTYEKQQKVLTKENQKADDKLANDLIQKIKASNLFKKLYDLSTSENQEDLKKWSAYVDEFNALVLKVLPQLKNVDKYLQQQFGGLFFLISISGGSKNKSFEIDGIGSGGQNFNVLLSQFTAEEWSALHIYLKARQKFHTQTDWTN